MVPCRRLSGLRRYRRIAPERTEGLQVGAAERGLISPRSAFRPTLGARRRRSAHEEQSDEDGQSANHDDDRQ